MGRESRQTRRARARREEEARKRSPQQRKGMSRWPIIAGVAVVVAAIALFGGLALANQSHKSASSTNSLPPEAPGKVIHGIQCNPGMETGTVYHVHAHLSMYDNGKAVALPQYIGFNYNHDCLYWTHTHDASGVIHLESPHPIYPTLGDFFDVWGKPLNASQIGTMKVQPGEAVHVFVNGKPYSGSPRNIVLTRHKQITIDVGTPVVPPKNFNFGNL